MAEWKKYRKPATQEMRDYIPGEDLILVSVAPGETPKEGGKIARDAHGSRWYVSPEFMEGNYVLAGDEPLSDGDIFLKHIESHLGKNQYPICTICGEDLANIVNGYIGTKK